MLTKGSRREKFTVGEAEAGERLDRLVATWLGLPRAMARRLIEEGNVTVNGKRAKPALRPAAGMEVVIALPEPPSPSELPQVPILYEDDDIVVVNKPPGLPVHAPGRGRPDITLVGVLARGRRLVGGPPERLGIVHRLDAGTSGVMVVAKSERAYQGLVAAFRARRVLKEYLALVEGGLETAEGEIEGAIGRDPNAPWRMRISPRGKQAATEFKVLRTTGKNTLLLVRIHTGRTHQIRVHLAAIGHPVVGDPVYGRPGPRLMLHAYKLGLPHPKTGVWLEFTAPPPAELAP